jgi:hypothetical protein
VTTITPPIFLVVVTADGRLEAKTAGLDPAAAVRVEVGEPGFDIAAVAAGFAVFVNDSGHVTGLPRNVIGTCLAATIARRHMPPLAGPVVFTGWDYSGGIESEIRPLDVQRAAFLEAAGNDLRILLGYAAGTVSPGASDGWQQAMRTVAAETISAPTPTIEVLAGTVVDAIRYLRGGGAPENTSTMEGTGSP